MKEATAPVGGPFPALWGWLRGIKVSSVLRWGGLLVFPILLALGVDFGQVAQSIKSASPALVISSFLVLQLMYVGRAFRWQLFCEAAGITGNSFARIYEIHFAGLFAGAALPQGAAPFTQVIFLSENGHSWRRGVLSVLADRAWETLSMMVVAMIAAIYLWRTFPGLSAVVLAVGGSATLALILLVVFRTPLLDLGQNHIHRLPAALRRQVDRLDLEELPEMLLRVRDRLPALVSISALVVFGQMLSVVLLAKAMGIELSPVYIAMGAALIGLVMMVPLTINGLGAREGILVLMFSAAGAGREEAIGLGLLMLSVNILSRLPGVIVWARGPKATPLSEALGAWASTVWAR